jgi:hypothetical protein
MTPTTPQSPSTRSAPEPRESSIEYVGRKEARIPLPVLFIAAVALAGTIIAFIHFSRA